MTTAPSSSPPLRGSSGPRLGRRLGAGGEAEVFEVDGQPRLAYKRHHHSTPERDRKLRLMAAHPPADLPPGVVLAWPKTVDPDGFTMERAPAGSVPLVSVYNPQSRAALAPGFGWKHLLRTALNVARTVEALHEAGVVVGDLNESNLLVDSRARVTMVDCDSVQVTDPDTGEVHRCTVGRPEFLAPEAQGVDLAAVDRTPAADSFALGVLLFLLLLEGRHPFAGVWRAGGEPPDVSARMRRAAWPWRRLDPRVTPPPLAIGPSALPWRLRRLVRRTFGLGCRWPALRPTASAWVAALESTERGLRTCRRSPTHVVPGRFRPCPWCARVDAGLPDPFPSPDGTGVAARRRPLVAARTRVTATFRQRLAGLRPHLASTVPVALAAGAFGAAVPVVIPLVVSVVILPLLAGAVAPTDRRSWSPFRLRDQLDSAVEGARTFLAASVGAAGALLALSALGIADVHRHALLPALSAAVTIGQVLRATTLVPAWSSVRDAAASARDRWPRSTATGAWAVAAIAVILAGR